MQIDEKEIKRILLEENYIAEEDIKNAEKFAKERDTSFLDYLFQESLITKDLLGQALADSFNIPYADLNSIFPSLEQVTRIPEGVAKKYRVVIFREDKEKLVVATDSPGNPDLILVIKKIFPDKKIAISYSLGEDIDLALTYYKKPLETRFSKIIEGKTRVVPEILEEIFNDALSYRASDIHFEPREDFILVRFRIDGSLQEAGRIPKDFYKNIINRIKVESNLRIDEQFSAQDGALKHQQKDRIVDFRTSIIPTIKGEKVVLRILSAYTQGLSLENLGLSSDQKEVLSDVVKKPFGMIIVSGPTGSGKTTTLYGLLKIVNSPDINITTIEDPVEYKVTGINQTQVSEKMGITFSDGLRSIVRQDPDVILVGEIRDKETAEISVNAALTGHLLFSTFHANNAATTIPRLLDMGVEPFLLASTLETVIGQRLVRKICEECRFSVTKNEKNFNTPKLKKAEEHFPPSTNFYEGRGCSVCNYTGYKGRTAIFELIEITSNIQDLILKNPSAKEVNEVAKKEGSRSMFEDGVEKVKVGVITLEELLRVTEI